jgi:hypothetical protein
MVLSVYTSRIFLAGKSRKADLKGRLLLISTSTFFTNSCKFIDVLSAMLQVFFYGGFEIGFHFRKRKVKSGTHTEGFFDDIIKIHQAL